MIGNTALHYAIREDRFDTVKFLISRGADVSIRTTEGGDDALQTASARGLNDILDFLLDHTKADTKTRIDMYELLGAQFIDEKHDISGGIAYLRQAMHMRYDDGVCVYPKPPAQPIAAFEFREEAQNMAALLEVTCTRDHLYLECLLIRDRVLGHHHKDTVFGLMYRGAWFMDNEKPQPCIELWKLAFSRRHDSDSTYITDECLFTLQTICKLLCDIYSEDTYAIRVDDVMEIAELSIDEAMRKKDAPQAPRKFLCTDHEEVEGIDKHHLLVLILQLVKLAIHVHPKRSELLKPNVHRLIASKVTGLNGVSLLHMACDDDTSTVYEHLSSFPDPQTAQYLIECGADVSAVDRERNTPLHVCALKLANEDSCKRLHPLWQDIAERLLQCGAHLDAVNASGFSAEPVLRKHCDNICPVKHVSLMCLSARVVQQERLSWKDGDIPRTLVSFVEKH